VTLREVTRLALAALAVAAASTGFAATDPAPACRASARSLPAEGYPGQQIVWRLEILRRPNVTNVAWLEAPAFPGFRAEWLPGQPERGAVTQDGIDWLARVEERALFAERPGELVIAPKGLRCSVAGGAQLEASIPATRVRVLELPEAGRPPDFAGLVGSLALEVAARPRTLALGGSARLELTLHGDANLWDARDPLQGARGLAGVEVFPSRPRLELEPGVELGVRRRFAYDLVPSREGRIEIPELRVPYFDPALRRYAVATSPALVLEVGPRATARSGESAAPATPAGADPNATGRTLGVFAVCVWALGISALGALAAGGALAWLRRRRRRAGGHAAILAALEVPASADEATLLARVLRLALEPELPGARSGAVEELRAPPGASAACERALALLARVERSRFDPQAACASRADVVAAIEALAGR